MKKRVLFVLVVAVLFGVVAVMPAYAQAQAPIKLKYANYFPPTHVFSQLAAQFCDEVKKRTNGKVEINYYPGGSLSTAPKMYDAIVNQVTDIGLSHVGYTRGRFPVTEMLDLPVGLTSGFVATHIKDDFYRKYQQKEWNDLHVLYFFGPGPQIFATRSKPARKMEDLKGLKFRSVSRAADTVRAVGAVPVALEMADLYDGLHRGLVDGTFEAMETWKGFKLGDAIKYATFTQRAAGMTYSFWVAMNKEKWNALPDDVKQVFTQMSQEWNERTALVTLQIDTEGQEFFKQNGGQMVTMPEEEIQKMQKAVESVIQNYMKDMETKGFKKAELEEQLKFARERIAYWSKQEKDQKLKSPYSQ
jgi:TRAP-type C4-dicarboxylate transport system substrate-binding protein